MYILTFDIEEWFHIGFLSDSKTWSKYEIRIHKSTDKILNFLDKKHLKGTFFILGWIAENYPEVVKKIYNQGHEIGCHSYYHKLVHRIEKKEFLQNTEKSIKTIEDIIGEKVIIYRAPGFSITKNTPWAFEILHQLGIKIDCSIFPAKHDYGGIPHLQEGKPSRIQYKNIIIKEFPLNTHQIFHYNFVFSGGGFFRLFPFFLIKKWTKDSQYVMSYFHPRDFDFGQQVLPQLTLMRKFKSYYGIKGAFSKFKKWLDNFETMSLLQADKQINWQETKIISF